MCIGIAGARQRFHFKFKCCLHKKRAKTSKGITCPGHWLLPGHSGGMWGQKTAGIQKDPIPPRPVVRQSSDNSNKRMAAEMYERAVGAHGKNYHNINTYQVTLY